MNRTTHDAIQDRDCHVARQSSILHPQPHGWALLVNSSRTESLTRPNIKRLIRDRRPWGDHPNQKLRVKKLRVKKLHVDDHVHLQHWVLLVAYQQQQATNHLLLSTEKIVRRLLGCM